MFYERKWNASCKRRKKRAKPCGEHTRMSMEWLMRITKGKFTVPARRGEQKYAFKFFPTYPSGRKNKKARNFFPLAKHKRKKIVFHMATHIIMRYRRRRNNGQLTCFAQATMGRGALIYGLCVVFHHSIINDHCVPISHFRFSTSTRSPHLPFSLRPLDPHHIKMFFLRLQVYPIFQFESDV